MKEKKALFLLDNNLCGTSVENLILAPDQLGARHLHDTMNFVYTAKLFKKYSYKMDSLSPFSFLNKNFDEYKFVIVNTHRINQGKLLQTDINRKRFYVKSKNLLMNGTHIIFLHHFNHLFTKQGLSELLGVKTYHGKNGFVDDKFNAEIEVKNKFTIDGERVLKNKNIFGKDEFTYQEETKSKFNTFISKSRNGKKFILFGNMKFNSSYAFIVDIHDVGRTRGNEILFKRIIENILQQLK